MKTFETPKQKDLQNPPPLKQIKKPLKLPKLCKSVEARVKMLTLTDKLLRSILVYAQYDFCV